MKKILSILLCTTICFACTPAHNDNEEENKNEENSSLIGGLPSYDSFFIHQYYRLECLESSPFQKRSSKEGTTFYTVMLDYRVKKLTASENAQFYHVTGEDNPSNTYLHMCDSYGPEEALIHRFDKLDVISNADYNDIPAGESLKDKVVFLSTSAWPIIKVGGKNHHRLLQSEIEQTLHYQLMGGYYGTDTYAPVEGKLSDLTSEDLYLLNTHPYESIFAFTEIPAIKDHVFTISYHEGSIVWTIDIPAKFE